MNIQDYTEAALRFDAHKKSRMLDALTHGLVAMEACFGRDTHAFLLELGDVQWELATLAHRLGIKLTSLVEAEQECCPTSLPVDTTLALALVAQAGKVSGLMEKSHRSKWVLDRPALRHNVLLTWQRFIWLVHASGFTIELVRRENIRKLSARYRGAA